MFENTDFEYFGSLKSNFKRTMTKIIEARDQGHYLITDILRASIIVKDIDDAENVYNTIDRHPNFTIVRITNNLNSIPQQHVVLNVIYSHGIIGEILINIGKNENQPLRA